MASIALPERHTRATRLLGKFVKPPHPVGVHDVMRRLSWFACALIACAPASTPTSHPPRTPPTRPAVAAVGSGGPSPRVQPPSYLTSSRIAALADGALVIDADSGMLVRTDRNGAAQARLSIGRGAGTLALDAAAEVAYVADRRGDHIVVVDLRAGLVQRTTWATPAEPFGVALGPGAATLFATFGADRALVAYDPRTGAEQWRVGLPAEPRAIAVSPDGKRALITTTTTGSLLDVSLAKREVSEIALDTLCDACVEGKAFARGAAVLFLDERRAIASFQREVPRAIDAFSSGSDLYGGTVRTPITQHLAFFSFDGAVAPTQVVAQIFANQPRSLSWDAARDILFVAGVATDTFLAVPGLTTSSTVAIQFDAQQFRLAPSETCGPDGQARGDGVVYVWCSLSRRIIAVAAGSSHESSPVADSSLPAIAQTGMVLFHAGRTEINRGRAITCATCHIEGRADGLSWQIQTNVLQTPILAGRVAQTAPYKWSGSDQTLGQSIRSTVKRLGGTGLDAQQTAALVAYIEALPPPRTATLDPAAVARGKAVFDSWDCGDCHRGPRFTDGQNHVFRSVFHAFETPSLIGVAASAPYYHDGSAPTLQALLRGEGKVRGMSDLARLTDPERADLAAYLSSL
jgi:cytochrome c553